MAAACVHISRKHGVKHPLLSWIVCLSCGTEKLVPAKDWARSINHYCSRECANEAKSGRRSPLKGSGRKVIVVCAQCGREKTVNPSTAARSSLHFCDSGCQGRYWSTHYVGTTASQWKEPVVVRCAWCGTAKTVRPSQACFSRYFCNRVCKGRHLAQEQAGAGNPNWQGDGSRYRTAKSEWEHRGGTEWKSSCRRRDGYACRICGAVKPKSSGGLHVHHIAPFATCEALRSAEANGATVCKSCHNWLHSNDGEPWRAAWEAEILQQLGHLLSREEVAS
jgi:hypothetical protein